MAAALADEAFGPGRAEGFASVVAVQPTQQGDLTGFLRSELSRLNRRISAACNRQQQLQLHGHSRLLDLERLLYLLQAAGDHPDLATTDQGSREALETLVSPLPSGELAERAAALLRKLHGVCYGDADAVRRDLAWLEGQGFFSATAVTTAIQPLPLLEAFGGEQAPRSGGVHGGHPPMADAAVFVRVMTLLRHLLQTPFDRPAEGPGAMAMQRHLLERLAEIPGGHGSGELATLRKDIEKTLTPYGFRPHHDNPRHGYCLGTALLSAPRLVEIHGVVQHVAQRLGDPTALDLLRELEERLAWGGIEVTAAPPLRTVLDGAHPGAESLQRGTLAEAGQAEQIETAILEHRRVRLLRLGASYGQGRGEEVRIWPLQLVFSGGLWHLAWEADAIGRPHGLLQASGWSGWCSCRPRPAAAATPASTSWRSAVCSGCCITAAASSWAMTSRPRTGSASPALSSGAASCRPCAAPARPRPTPPFARDSFPFPSIRSGWNGRPSKRSPRSAAQGTTADWVHPELARVLTPNPIGDSHPHPLEIDLPPWILARGIALRRWLFSHGSALRIEAPEALRQEQQGQALEVLALGQRR